MCIKIEENTEVEARYKWALLGALLCALPSVVFAVYMELAIKKHTYLYTTCSLR